MLAQQILAERDQGVENQRQYVISVQLQIAVLINLEKGPGTLPH
jgi:hypothetical protein